MKIHERSEKSLCARRSVHVKTLKREENQTRAKKKKGKGRGEYTYLYKRIQECRKEMKKRKTTATTTQRHNTQLLP